MSRGVGAGDSVAVCAGVCVDAGACVDTGADVGVMGVSSLLNGVSEWSFFGADCSAVGTKEKLPAFRLGSLSTSTNMWPTSLHKKKDAGCCNHERHGSGVAHFDNARRHVTACRDACAFVHRIVHRRVPANVTPRAATG
jgi:hypothetical protein